MKLKKELVILILVIAALVLYLALRTKDQTHTDLPQPATVESSKINRLVITQGDAVIELTKKDEQWFIGPQNYPANKITVSNMLNAAADLTVTALVSESRNYERYDLTADKKINARAFSDDSKQRDFDIGRIAPTFQHTFIKLLDDPNVYHARGSIKNTFDQTVDDLRDKTVLSLDKQSVEAVTIQKGDQTLTISLKEVTEEKPQSESSEKPAPPQKQWQSAEGQAVDQAAADGLLGMMAKLNCDTYMEDGARETLNDPQWTLSMKAGEKMHTLTVFAKKDADATQVPAVSSMNDYAFLLLQSNLETMEKHMDKLLNLPEPK